MGTLVRGNIGLMGTQVCTVYALLYRCVPLCAAVVVVVLLLLAAVCAFNFTRTADPSKFPRDRKYCFSVNCKITAEWLGLCTGLIHADTKDTVLIGSEKNLNKRT